jgi:FkbM family methyltransferase
MRILPIVLFFISSLAAEPVFHSQHKQDQFIYTHFFQDQPSGVFIDIGAHDGVTINNTLFFEEKGWKGICIEPMPAVFQQLQKNRKAICVHGCITAEPGVAEFTQVTGYAEMLSGLTSKYDLAHQKRIDQEIKQYGGEKKILQIACFNLNDLLAQHGFIHIDYLSIDTEGGELEIVKSIDFEKYDIEAMSIENNYNDPAFNSFLSSKGYRLITKRGCDEIYKKPKLSPTQHLSSFFIQQFLPENPVILKIGHSDKKTTQALCKFWKKGKIYLFEERARIVGKLKKRYRHRKDITVSAIPSSFEKLPAVDFLLLEGKGCALINNPHLQTAKVIQLIDHPADAALWLESNGYVSLYRTKNEALFVRKFTEPSYQ